MTMGTLVEVAVLFPVSQLIAVGAERSSAVLFWYCLEVSEEGQGVYLVEAFDDVGFEGFSLFFVGVLVFVFDEISIGAVEGEHQAVKFTMGDDRGLEVGVAK